MKKILLSALSLAMFSTVSVGQTNSELSGNDVTTGNKGYLYSFTAPTGGNDVNVANCTNASGVTTANGTWDAFGSNLAAITMNAAGGLEVTISAQTVGANNLRVAAIRLSTGNCGTLQPGGYVDITAQKDITLNASATADVEFSILAASDAGGWKTHDAAFNTATATTTLGKLTIAAVDTSWNGAGDLANVLGFELWLPAGAVIANDVTITIAAMAFGDANLPAIESATSVASLGGNVYPNPANDVVNVNVGSATNATVVLTDITGKVVSSVSGVSGTTTINTSAVPAGLYIVSITSANGVATEKVTVQ